MSTQRFEAVLAPAGASVRLLLPFSPDEVWGVKDRHYVTGTVNGHAIRGRIDTDGERSFVSLGPAWRRDNGVQAGDQAEVVLQPEGPQLDNMAADIVAAFEPEPQALEFFQSLATFYRKGYTRWIDGAKRPETRASRIAEMIALLKERRRQR